MFRRILHHSRTTVHRRNASTTSHNRFESYVTSLRRRYPSADPASLFISFLILHELTAILPLSILFGTFHYLGVGTSLIEWTLKQDNNGTYNLVERGIEDREQGKWTKDRVKLKVREWSREGETKAENVGRRYGWFGWDQESREDRIQRKAKVVEGGTGSEEQELSRESLKVTGDVANVAAAYLVVKALLPLRILISLRLSPTLANVISKRFTGLRSRGMRMLKKRNEESKP